MKKILKFKAAEVERLVRALQPTDKIQLVGDDGVYLMSFAQGADTKRTIVYAEGINPEVDDFDDWWNQKRALYGGDDGFDEIGSAEELGHIARQAREYVLVRLMKTKLEVTCD